MTCHVSKLIFIIVIIFTSILPFEVSADNITIYNTDFAVDEIKTVDQQTLQVTIQGQTAIIAKDNLPNYVLKTYLHNNQSNSEAIKKLSSLLEQSIKANDHLISTTVLIGLLENKNISIDSLLSLFFSLEELASFSELLKEALLSANGWTSNPILSGHLLCYLIVDQYDWVKSKVLSYVYIHSVEVKSVCEERYSRLIATGSTEKINNFVESLQDVFGSTDSFVEPLFKHSSNLIEGEQLVRGNNLSQVHNLVQLASPSAKYSSAVSKMIVKLFHEQADSLSKANKPSQAINLLAWFDVNWRTDETHKLVLTAVRQLNAENFELYNNLRALQFLEFLSTKDRSIKTNYIDALQRVFEESIVQDKFEQLSQIYSELSKIRSTDKTANNNLLVLWATSLATKGDLASAKNQYQKINGWIGFSNLLKLLLSGVVIDLDLLWLIFTAIAIFVLLIIAIAIRPKPKEYLARREYDRTNPALSGAHVRQIFEANQGNNSLWREYEDLMQGFGLTKNSSLRDLKKAYRNLVKSAHPDVNPEDFSTAQSDFLQISKDYERLIELRALLQVK